MSDKPIPEKKPFAQVVTQRLVLDGNDLAKELAKFSKKIKYLEEQLESSRNREAELVSLIKRMDCLESLLF